MQVYTANLKIEDVNAYLGKESEGKLLLRFSIMCVLALLLFECCPQAIVNIFGSESAA